VSCAWSKIWHEIKHYDDSNGCVIFHMNDYYMFVYSNVIEKCISHAPRSERALLIEEVCNDSNG